jgi:hypothetical protein
VAEWLLGDGLLFLSLNKSPCDQVAEWLLGDRLLFLSLNKTPNFSPSATRVQIGVLLEKRVLQKGLHRFFRLEKSLKNPCARSRTLVLVLTSTLAF